MHGLSKISKAPAALFAQIGERASGQVSEHALAGAIPSSVTGTGTGTGAGNACERGSKRVARMSCIVNGKGIASASLFV